MTAHRIEEIPLEFQINSRVTENDYLLLRKVSRNEGTTQAALIRSAVRQYLSQSKAANPPEPKEAF